MPFSQRLPFSKVWHHCQWLICPSVLLLWWLLPHSIASSLFIVVWVIVAQLMFAGLVEKAFLQRKAWLGQYLEAASPWHRMLRAGVLIIVWNQLLSLTLAPVLLNTLRRLDSMELLFLLLTSGAFAICYHWFNQRLKGHVITDHLPAVTRQLTVLPTSGLLTADADSSATHSLDG